MKRLRQAHSVKVQPNKTGTSFMQGQSVVLTKENIEKKGVVFNSGANTPYNDLSNNKTWEPNPADIAKAKKELGYRPRNVKNAIKDCVVWMNEQFNIN